MALDHCARACCVRTFKGTPLRRASSSNRSWRLLPGGNGSLAQLPCASRRFCLCDCRGRDGGWGVVVHVPSESTWEPGVGFGASATVLVGGLLGAACGVGRIKRTARKSRRRRDFQSWLLGIRGMLGKEVPRDFSVESA